jgi:uncharacterized membrane protein YgcG
MRVLMALCALLLAGVSWAQGFVVKSFNADMSLDKNGSVRVRETIVVHFTESKHGIYRDIPTALPNASGSTRSIYISDIDCGADGSKIENQGGNLDIRLGRADTMLPGGSDHTYEIHYTVKNAINWFDHASDWEPYSEFYWNVTGDQWQAPIEAASVVVHFPAVAKSTDVRARIFAGPYGDRESLTLAQAGKDGSNQSIAVAAKLGTDSLAAFRQTTLESGSGMTIVLDLPYEAITQPTATEKASMFLMPNLGFFLPLFALLLGWFLFVVFGKDPASGPMVVQFDPPDSLTGPESGAFLDETVDQRDLASGIISLAVKGYLTIEPIETGFLVKSRSANLHMTDKNPGVELSPFEQKLQSLLAAEGPDITPTDLRSAISPEVMSLKTMLYKSLVDRGYYLSSPQNARVIMGLGMVVLVGMMGLFLTAISPIPNPLPAIIGGVISIPLIVFFVKAAPRRTPDGAKAWAKLRGFEDFMRRAQSPELNWLSEKHPDQALFEQYLPHAVAFGLTAQWAKAFEGIELQNPSWYGGNNYPFNVIYFGSDLNHLATSVGETAFTPPRSSGASGGSSGFGGGGFSGGGFGGGGGGSW